MWKGINGDIAWTLDSHYYLGCGSRGGREREIVYWVNDMTYQSKTGALTPGAHAGSYNGQDAYNDMLVTDESINNTQTVFSHSGSRGICSKLDSNRLQRSSDSNNSRGGDSVSEPIMMSDRKGHNGITEDGTATTLTSQEKDRPVIGTSIIRRLTPLECTRLQGFQDGWVDIGDWVDSNGKKHKDADSPKYKALGNSIAVGYANNRSGFWCWLARRICAQYERQITLGSLFDGIGGFPLAFEAAGAKAVWASEIEEFCIAVTKKHFPEEEDT